MTGTNSIVFGVAACILLASSIMLGRQQDRELSGIRGLPVEGHDIVAGVEILGTKQIDFPILDAEVTHDTEPTYGNPRHLTLKFKITEGKRSRSIARAALLPSPAQRCSR